MPTDYLLTKVLSKERLRQQHPFKIRIRKLGLRQTDLSIPLCCSDAELSRWLNNRRTMPWSAEKQLEDILNKLEAEVFKNE